MRYGLHVVHFGPCADPRALVSLAVDAEAAGWDGFFLWDHLLMRWPADVADPWIALAAIAARTTRLRIGTMVTPLARRRPWKVARETVTLDHLSGGRLTLGVGLGTHPEEFEDFGEPAGLKRRAAMLDEALAVLAGLWSGAPFTHEGAHYRVKAARFTPTPVQQPRIPVWVAGKWPNRAPFRRAARWDGVYPLGQGMDFNEKLAPAQIREIVAYIMAHREDDAPFDVAHEGATQGGGAAQDRDLVAPYAEAGATWWLEDINPWRFGWRGVGDWPPDTLKVMRDRVAAGPPRV
ncbi:MAG: LLM class flavin-dependent oxidoreductase [Anaerolineae bacterium]